MPPCFIRQLTPARLKPVDYIADSLADAVRYEPADGVYTVTNTYNTYQVLKLDAHLDRLEDSARQAGIPLVLQRGQLRLALRQMIAEAGYGDVRFRITVPRNAARLILSLEPFKPLSPEFIAQGIHCVTMPNSARVNPTVKATDWLHARGGVLTALPPGVYEAILLDDAGHLLEGTNSNFYTILDGELHTAGTGVLAGIARQIVLEITPPILPLRLEAVSGRDIPRLAEAFITSSSRGIVPVVKIDDHTIGDGKPGSKTMALRAAYADWVNNHLEDL